MEYIIMKNSDKNEKKNERFKRVATARTNEVLRRLKILGNCSNRLLYDYSEEEIKKIFKAIEERTKEIKTKFFDQSRDKKDEFTL
jgi:hypothetical protein